ncbi:hypothetical protein EG329_014485 [Mollisiaceae sp. DMI_Dod_QoI]|nr:hypothetical protein EG329_014485 [Helotiales sp. DMI_Dod_QoI]
MVFETIKIDQKCRFCVKIETKRNRIKKEDDKIARWSLEGNRKASTEIACEIIAALEREILELDSKRKRESLKETRRLSNALPNTVSLNSLDSPIYKDSLGPSVSSTRMFRDTILQGQSTDRLRLEQNMFSVCNGVNSLPSTIRREQEAQVRPLSASYGLDSLENEEMRNARPLASRVALPCDEIDIINLAKRIESKGELPSICKGKEVDQVQANVAIIPYVDKDVESTLEPTDVKDLVAIQTKEHFPKCGREVEVSWKCACGATFQETVIEYKPGAAQAMVQLNGSGASIDIERLAEEQNGLGSSSYESVEKGNSLCQRSVSRSGSKDISTDTDPGAQSHRVYENSLQEYFLMCRPKGSEMVLKHVDVTEAKCDYTSYFKLNNAYYVSPLLEAKRQHRRERHRCFTTKLFRRVFVSRRYQSARLANSITALHPAPRSCTQSSTPSSSDT